MAIPVRRLPAERSARGDATASGHRAIWRALVPFGFLTLLWLWLFLDFSHLSGGPQAHYFGVDFAHNMSSAYVVDHGGDPYNSAVLVRAEHLYLQSHGVPNHRSTADRATIWGGYPPLFFWLLRPLTHYPFPPVALAWIAALYALMAIGFVVCLRFLGWSARVVPTAFFLTAPQTMDQAYFANPAALVFPLVMLSLALHRRRPLVAGLLLSLSWLKPQMGLPCVFLLFLFAPHERRRLVSGFVVGTVALLLLTLLGPGPQSLFLWLQGMVSVSRIVGEQSNLVPLVGLYAGWAPSVLRTGLELLTAGLALGLTFWWWLRTRRLTRLSLLTVAWLAPVWLLALPYAHFPDEILLVPALLAVLGPNGRRITRFGPALCVYLLYLSTLLYNFQVGQVQLLSLPLLAVTAIMYVEAARTLPARHGARRRRQTAAGMEYRLAGA